MNDLGALSPRQRALVELRLLQRREQRSQRSKTQIVAQPPAPDFPLSFSQQRLWFVDQLEAGSYFYNVGTAVRLSGLLASDVLRRAFDEVVRRHESLRTTFRVRGDEPVQVVGLPFPMELPVIDLQAIAADERAPEVRRLVAGAARLPFDLAQAPLVRCQLIRLHPREHVFVCVMHHILSDWWSLRVLVRELAATYEAFSRALPSPLPPLPIQYRDFAVWQRQWLRDEALAEQLAYWRTRLAGAPRFLALPIDRPRPEVQIFRGSRQAFSLPPELSEDLSALARQEGCALFTVLLAAFYVLLHHHSGEEDIVISAPVSYRNWPESEGLIGFFVNTLLLRSNLSGNPGLRAFLRSLHSGFLDDLAHQHLPLDRLIEELAPRRSLSHSPFLQVGINLSEDLAVREPATSELDIEVFDFDPGFSQFELNLVLSHSRRGLDGWLQYRTDLFSEARIAQLIAEYGALLEAIRRDPEVSLSRLRASLAELVSPESPLSPTLEGFNLSPQQGSLWALQREEPGTPFRALCAIEIAGQVEVADCRRALQAVVTRYEILRTNFQEIPGLKVALQFVSGGAPFTLCHRDLSGGDRQAQDEQLDRILDETGREPRDLAQGPALQATLATLSPSRQVLLLCLPALCGDSTTLIGVAAEIARFLGGVESSGEPIQYADVAQWENEILASYQDAEENSASHDSAGILPFGMAHPAGAGFAPRPCPLPKLPHLGERIDELARRLGVDAGTILLTCWQDLLRRLVDPPDVAIGVGYSGRNDPQLLEVLGPLSCHLPLRSPAGNEGAMPFGERLVATAMAMRAVEERYLGSVLRAISPENRKNSPDFSFDFDELPGVMPAAEVELSIQCLRVYGDRFRLKLACSRQGEKLAAELHFDSAAQSLQEVGRLGAWYLALLANALDAPDCPLEDFSLLEDKERRQLVYERNATRVDLGPVGTLPELFEEQAKRAPQAVALVSTERRLTYSELDAAANRLAGRLLTLGAGPEVRVALSVERSIEMVVAILAIFKTGAAYVPLDPDFPGERLSFMLEDSQASIVLTEERWLPRFTGTQVPVIHFGREAEGVGSAPAPGPGRAWLDGLAYVIYTSGSTGRPKGVMVSHRAIANRILWMRRELALAPDDVVLLKTPYSFDASIWEIFLPLVSGVQLVIAEPGGHRDAAYLLSVIAERRVTILQLVPSQLAMVLEMSDLGLQGRSLRRLFCGGEPLPGEAVRRFRASLDASVCNLYGPTEAAIDATFHPCPPDSLPATVPIGRPISNVGVYVLDSRLLPVPGGLGGELLIGGVGLARGYLRRPDLTSERFVPHPFSDAPGERLYRTGDWARSAEGGEIEFLGRTDGQVKVRGFRMELGEIGAALARHPEIAAAVVVVRHVEPQGPELVAYYQATASASPVMRDLREFLQASLPEPMVPAIFVELAALPQTPNGKLDRKALPEPGPVHSAVEYVAPSTAVEQALAQIWESLLGIDKVGANDSFFDLGGHSLQAMRLVSHVRDSLGVELRVRTIFETPSLAGLARNVTAEMIKQLGEELVAQLLAPTPDPSSAGGESP